ncbi:MAG: hypothetical protein ACRC2H_09415, partial [Silanimonas sp.]
TFGIASETLFVDADTMTPEGLRTRSGDRAPAALLHAAAVPAGEMHERRNGLCLANVRTQIGSAPRELYIVLYPFERGNALRIDDVIGAGMAADGYTTEVALDAVPGDVAATSLLQDADAHWVLEVLAANAGHDEGERARALLRAAWQAGITDLRPIPAAVKPVPPADEVVRHEPARHDESAAPTSKDAATASESHAHGWWAPPGGPALWFETSTLNFDELSVDIATIAKQMQANREQDGVPGAEHILLLPFASNCKLRMIWFDPGTGDALGADEYTLVLRVPEEEDDHFDASDFEYLCRDAGQDVVETEGYDGPKLYFRWEWGGDIRPLTWP